MRLIGAHRKERINMAPDLAHQILDTPWQKQKYAMYWNIKKIINKSFQSFRFLDTYSLKAKAILDLLKWSVINIAPLTLNSVCNAFDGLMGR